MIGTKCIVNVYRSSSRGRPKKRVISEVSATLQGPTGATSDSQGTVVVPYRRRSSTQSSTDIKVSKSSDLIADLQEIQPIKVTKSSKKAAAGNSTQHRGLPNSSSGQNRKRKSSSASSVASATITNPSEASGLTLGLQSDSLGDTDHRSRLLSALRSNSQSSLVPGLPYYPPPRSRSHSKGSEKSESRGRRARSNSSHSEYQSNVLAAKTKEDHNVLQTRHQIAAKAEDALGSSSDLPQRVTTEAKPKLKKSKNKSLFGKGRHKRINVEESTPVTKKPKLSATDTGPSSTAAAAPATDQLPSTSGAKRKKSKNASPPQPTTESLPKKSKKKSKEGKKKKERKKKFPSGKRSVATGSCASSR